MGKQSTIDDTNLVDYYKTIFPENTYMPNLYEYFVKKATLLTKDDGYNCLIVPDRLGANESLSYLREFLLKNNNLIEIIYRWDFPEIVTDTMTYILQKKICSNYDITVFNEPFTESAIIENKQYLSYENFDFKSYKNRKVYEIIKKLNLNSNLKDYALATSGFGGKSTLITQERINSEQIKVIKGRSIQKFLIKDVLYFDFIDENITGRTRDIVKLGSNPKILVRKTGTPLIAAIDYDGIYPEQSLYFIYNIAESLNPLFMLGLFNSYLFNWIYVNELVTNIDSTPQLKNSDLYKFPIKEISNEAQQPFIEKVDQILTLKQSNPSADTTLLEREIDLMVYELYGLSEEEIGVVEGK
jgi:hypothetical protein